jgi:hypothetical protein
MRRTRILIGAGVLAATGLLALGTSSYATPGGVVTPGLPTTVPPVTVPAVVTPGLPTTVPPVTVPAVAIDQVFCAYLHTTGDAFAGLRGLGALSSAEAAQRLAEYRALLDRAHDLAPLGLRADVDAGVAARRQLLDAIEAADHDLSKVDVATVKALSHPGDGSARIARYVEKTCGVVSP